MAGAEVLSQLVTPETFKRGTQTFVSYMSVTCGLNVGYASCPQIFNRATQTLAVHVSNLTNFLAACGGVALHLTHYSRTQRSVAHACWALYLARLYSVIPDLRCEC